MFIKGFNAKLQCRDFQFEIGKIYDTGADDESLELCSDTVFHFCKSLQQVHNFYNAYPDRCNRFCEIEVLGKLIEDDDKCGSNKIRIVREIEGEELQKLRGLENGNTGLFNTGYWNTGERNTGYWNASNSNTGDRNTGDRNTGYCNTGNSNTGVGNTGCCNTGNRNTGCFNQCDGSTGFFNTKPETISIFNKDSGMTFDECVESDWFGALFSTPFVLTEWIAYTEEEKKEVSIRQCIGGYLEEYTFHEACAKWWATMAEKNKILIQTMPNFNKDIFKEITGIDVEEENR